MNPEIVYHAAASLDGFIAAPDGGVHWLEAFQTGGDDHGFNDFYATVDGLVMGSRTYEFALAHPPWMSPDKPSWVFTRRELPLADPSITLTKDEPAAVVAAARAQGLERLWLMGGGRLATAFRRAGLIARYSIAVVPVVLGEGIPLFEPAPGLDSLRLLDLKTYPSGIVVLEYAAAATT